MRDVADHGRSRVLLSSFAVRFRVGLMGSLLFCDAGTIAAPFQPLTMQSRSGQFTVAGLPRQARADAASAVIAGIAVPVRAYQSSTSALSFVRLDPALVAVSCEDIKTALLRELGTRDGWKGSVRILLHPVREDKEPIYVTSIRHPAGWTYSVEMPDQVDRSRFIKSITQVLVLEMANRRSGPSPAELPPWLVDGLAQHLETTSLSGLTLELQTGISQRRHNHDPLRAAREFFRTSPPLSLDQLDWPMGNTQDQELYQRSSHLFVHELLRLKTGRSCLLRTIEEANRYLNWQTTFFRVFEAYFPKLLDLDKWWTLRTVQFTQGEAYAHLNVDEEWRQIDDVLLVRAAFHSNSNQLPARADLSLQRIILEWPWTDQQLILEERIQQLQSVALRAQPASANLLQQYRVVLIDYLQKQQGHRTVGGRTEIPLNQRSVARQTIRQLNSLDTAREQLKRIPVIVSSASPLP